MHRIYQLLNLLPAPLFLSGFIYSVFFSHSHGWEMPAMWLVMFVAHLTPWLLFYQQHFARN
jgi:hypothetical protein